MGRDRKRVLIAAAVSLVMIIAGTLIMDWYRVAFEAADSGLGKISIAIDLRSLHTCSALRVCTTAPLGPLPGMFPTLAAVTLWSSLAFAALVVFQAGVRLLTGNANDALAKFGYMFALTTISIAFATAYLFGPESEGPVVGLAAEMGLSLHRTWAPLTLLIGLVAGFATLYMAVAPDPESGDLGDSYKPVTIVLPTPDELAAMQSSSGALPAAARAATRPLRPGTKSGSGATPTGTQHAAGSAPITRPAASSTPTGVRSVGTPVATAARPTIGPNLPVARPQTVPASTGRPVSGPLPLIGPIGPSTITSEVQIVPSSAAAPREQPRDTEPDKQGSPIADFPTPMELPAHRRDLGTPHIAPKREPTPELPPGKREITAQMPAAKREVTPSQAGAKREVTPSQAAAKREPTGQMPAAKRETTGQMPAAKREPTGQMPAAKRETTGPLPAAARETTGQLAAAGQVKSGPISTIPEQLRNRLRYVALTAELTGGGIDARREDGTSRLVLWRDVVGIVARRLPAALDGATFVDIVSTAGSTLRILPWTRLTGDPIEGDGDQRPRSLIERIAQKSPAAKLDPATRQFLETDQEAAQLRDVETLRAHDARLA